MAYYIDLSTISIESYKQKLPSAYLPPSRMCLREQVEERFHCFKQKGFNNLEDIQKGLKNKAIFADLSKQDCFFEDYLKILLREINSMHPRPNKIADFPDISSDVAKKLEKIGIKNTVKLYDRVLDAESRQKLSDETGIAEKQVLELTKLTDLSRIKWVGVTFARMLYDIGVETVEMARKVDPEKLHQQINEINEERVYFKGKIGLNDMFVFVDAAKEVLLEINY